MGEDNPPAYRLVRRLLRDDIGMTASAKLMLMAPVTYTTETGTRKANDYGIMRLRELMVGLYHDYQIISGSRERIKGLLPEYLSAKEDCKRKIADLNIKKGDLKKDFKEGRLPQKSYMEQLSGIKDEMFAHQRALTENLDVNSIYPTSSATVYQDTVAAMKGLKNGGEC